MSDALIKKIRSQKWTCDYKEGVAELKRLSELPATPCSVAGFQLEHCPKCDWPGVYIRTRYFDDGIADVWMCDNSKCPSYRLYWHKDKPQNISS